MKRMVKLIVTLSPIAVLYPLLLLSSNGRKNDASQNQDAHIVVNAILGDTKDNSRETGIKGWYYRVCLACVESSGACVIKCMQWAGSRPDLFGHEFCSIFSKLQDQTRPHSWSHTEQLLSHSYGPNWHEKVQIPSQQSAIIGSGCIGQVYRGNVKLSDNTWKEVAIKVLHPCVEDDVQADLDLMRLSVRYMDYITPLFPGIKKLKWLNLEGIVEELAQLLELQMDLRYEAKNLQTFRKNFQNNSKIMFPQLIKGYEPTRQVLIEEFCNGIPILQFCRQNFTDHPEVLSDLCHIAIEAVCQMIFLDNFVHGK
jgi:aarF domain-containing kinase